MPRSIPFYQQLDQMDCGPTCLRMVAKYYGKSFSLQFLRERSFITRSGVSIEGIMKAAEYIGMRAMAVKVPFMSKEQGSSLLDAPFPCIVHWNQNHFVVAYKANERQVWIADPGEGRFKIDHDTFKQHWISDGNKGVALLLLPTPSFYEQESQAPQRIDFRFLLQYIRPYKKMIGQLAVGLVVASLLQLVFPFLTQSIVDVGIANQNISFIYLVLIAQLMLFLSQTAVNVIQRWILLHLGTRVNVYLISDFLIKLMKLPIGFFDTKMIGDLMQRIKDHHRIESFLTSSTLSVVLSAFTFVVFSIVLLIYHPLIFAVFLISSILYVTWVLLFLKRRAAIDYKLFQELSNNQSSIIELIQGMQEIKLQNSERKRRQAWVNIQSRVFNNNMKSLSIAQYQDVGAGFISQLKDILITIIAATAVIENQMTLGMMLAVQYIVGQLNGPLQQMIAFIRAAQDARISLERLGEIHNKEDEEETDERKIQTLPEGGDIHIENLSFKYNELNDEVLRDINLTIPKGKVTAIVGTSGSGKTTLVKLLLGFYQPTKGNIKVGGLHLKNISSQLWRGRCGAVMQDGYIFSDNIANNIAESDDHVDSEKLMKAVKTANIDQFVESLALGFNTQIGKSGEGLSQGQKQRVLIARAVYKDPDYLFFDEATNALDAKNEKIIVENLEQFFSGRTVVVVAHRLSTVRNADQIVVLERGALIEQGTHEELIAEKGAYFNLVKNQLELGN
jgi:ATP-binding cassette subfamily B protein